MAVKMKEIILALIIFNLLLNIIVNVFGIQPQQRAHSLATTNTLFPVLFESPRVLVVRKPHGIGHHDESSSSSSRSVVGGEGDGESITPGVISLLRKERQHQAEEMGERLYGVHRLDKVTSGILVLAKDATTASTLSDYFARGEIQKVYFGLSAKKPQKKKQGLVQGGMTRSRNKSWKLVRKQKAGQKDSAQNFAKTRFFTTGLKATGIDGTGITNTSNLGHVANIKTVAMFRPYTGKTHQLRVAAKAMGIPLLGDPIYKDGGGSKSGSDEDTVSATSRTMLHASGIHIPEFLDQAEINVWCSPTFFHDGGDGDGEDMGIAEEIRNDDSTRRSLSSDLLDLAVEKLMTKNCDVPGILETMLIQQQDQQE
jgi:23S rRNA-/tRNA-specific pseudouridylate synthase